MNRSDRELRPASGIDTDRVKHRLGLAYYRSADADRGSGVRLDDGEQVAAG
jgi:hypothetical protein